LRHHPAKPFGNNVGLLYGHWRIVAVKVKRAGALQTYYSTPLG
jgi:hypothetical protein